MVQFILLVVSLHSDQVGLCVYLAFYIIVEIIECDNTCHLFRLDFKTEIFLYNNHDIYEVKAVDSYILFQLGFGKDFLLVNFKILYEEITNFAFYFKL